MMRGLGREPVVLGAGGLRLSAANGEGPSLLFQYFAGRDLPGAGPLPSASHPE